MVAEEREEKRREERGAGTADVMCNNIHALCKCLCVLKCTSVCVYMHVCVCVRAHTHALALRASLLALINNSAVLSVRLPPLLHSSPPPTGSSVHPSPHPLCPSPKHHTLHQLPYFCYPRAPLLTVLSRPQQEHDYFTFPTRCKFAVPSFITGSTSRINPGC